MTESAMAKDAFIALLQKIPIEQITQIPPSKIPENLTEDDLRKLSSSQRDAVEHLIFAAMQEDMAKRRHLREQFSGDVVTILETFRSDDIQSETRPFADALKEFNASRQALNSAGRADAALVRRLKSDMYIHWARLTRGEQSLTKLLLDKEKQLNLLHEHIPSESIYRHLFEKAIEKLTKDVMTIEFLMTPYLVERLSEIKLSMLNKRHQISQQHQQQIHIQSRIDSMEREILGSMQQKRKSREGWLGNKRMALDELQEELKKHEIFVSEHDLIKWLDDFVLASTNRHVLARAREVITDIKKLLFALLSRYCELQERSAQHVVARHASVFDPAQMINFFLASEKFVLDYFARKKKEQSHGLSETAKLRFQLVANLEQELLAEIRKQRHNVSLAHTDADGDSAHSRRLGSPLKFILGLFRRK